MRSEEVRICARCGKNPTYSYQAWCAECYREYNRQYHEKHPNYRKEYYRRMKSSLKGETLERWKEARRESARKWLEKSGNREKARAASRRYRVEHLDACRERTRRWRKLHPDYRKQYAKKLKEAREHANCNAEGRNTAENACTQKD